MSKSTDMESGVHGVVNLKASLQTQLQAVIDLATADGSNAGDITRTLCTSIKAALSASDAQLADVWATWQEAARQNP